MFLDANFSEIGRTTAQRLNSLRRQLGVGVDPVFDYSSMMETQRKMAMASKESSRKKGSDVLGEGGSSSSNAQGATSGLDLLKRALREVVGGAAGLEEPEAEEADALVPDGRPGFTAADARELSEQNRATSSFKAQGRSDVAKHTDRFKAPPIGTYRPKDDLLRPRVMGVDFKMRDKTRSLQAAAVEREIERLQLEKMPFDHLVKQAVSVELQDDVPEKLKPRLPNHQISKVTGRTDIIKAAGIEYNENTFTEGIFDGYLRCSHVQRTPCYDFAKTTNARPKERQYYFQPGRYQINLDAVRPRKEIKNIPFDKRPQRNSPRELLNGVEIKERAGDHALYTMSRSCTSCPLLEKKVHVPDLSKYSNRKPMYALPVEAHDVRVDEAVQSRRLSFDAMAADKLMRPRTRGAEDFSRSLPREKHAQTMRSYGTDPSITLAKNQVNRGVAHFEGPADRTSSPGTARKTAPAKDTSAAIREPMKMSREVPPRKRDLSSVEKFERGVRPGDARCEANQMSRLAGGISELRGTRSYQALPRHEHPETD